MSLYFMGAVGLAVFIGLALFAALCFRIVVPTNAVHIVQSAGTTTSYGRGMKSGNTYYRWPAWIPLIGVRVTNLPVSIFDQALKNYSAYDVDRVPFVIDVVGFFRVSDSNMAAERVKDFAELQEQLLPILQGAARSILASSPIDEILGSRATFGEKFTAEVTNDLKSWGVEPVKSLELMDIRDAEGSQVIEQIRSKKMSAIEKDSRVAVAGNRREAEVAEVEAEQAVGIRKQESEQAIGERAAAKASAVGMANQKAEQAIQEEAAVTAEKQMAVVKIQQTRAAEIAKGVAEVAAAQAAEVNRIEATGVKAKTVTEAEGLRDAKILEAAGIEAKGKADGAAQEAVLMAPVNAQIALAEKIAESKGYQEYLIGIRQIEKDEAVGIHQAEALKNADIRIITTAADATAGLDLVSLGTKIGALVQGFKTTTDKAE